MSHHVTLIIEHNKEKYLGSIGTITSTHLGPEDHGIFTAILTVQSPDSSVNVGGYNLQGDTGFAVEHMTRILQVAGVSKWEDLVGTAAIVLFPHTEGRSTLGLRAVGLAALMSSDVYIFEDHAREWRDAHNG